MSFLMKCYNIFIYKSKEKLMELFKNMINYFPDRFKQKYDK